MTPMLEIAGLSVEYRSHQRGRKSAVRVIDELSLDVFAGEVLAVVGESGSGKSTLANAILGLLDGATGSIRFDDTELLNLRGSERRPVQRQIQMVFQNPLLSLSPRRSVNFQIDEPLRVHTDLSRSERQERVDGLLQDLELSPAVAHRYPHQLSGGQAQRVVLARALSLQPSLLVFDEPTSALDVSVQAGVLNLLQRIKNEHDLTYIFITHDLGVARHLADRIAVMRTGEIVELRPARDLFENPSHGYTKSLLASSLSI